MKNGLIIDKEGNRRYYMNNLLHRVARPAIEFADGSKFWLLNGELHREYGPAVEYTDGEKRWFFHGNELTQPKEFKTMEEWFEKLNTDEKYSLPFINNIIVIIEYIKKPTPKQKRLHAMKWKL